MKKLLNTLFVTTEDAYLSLDGENIVVSRDRHEIGRFPLHTLDGIISFSYAGDPGKECLKEVELHIASGETVGILGGTGTSKTTLVQLIPRLYDVAEGAVRVGGVDVREYDVETLRNEVAMVLQKNVLFSGTIRENLRWGDKNATDEEMYGAVGRGDTPEESLEHLLELSKQRGAPDNVTAVLLYHE